MTDLVDDEKERVKGVLRSTCRGGEEEEGIVRVRGGRSAERPDGVGRHVRAQSCGLRACESYGRAVVEEVRGATEGERIVSGLFPEEFEEVDRLAMGEDVQQAQKLSVDATRGGHDGWEESQKSIGCRVCLAVLPHFDVGSVVEQRIGVNVAQLSVVAHVPPAVTREIVYQCHVDDQISFTCKVDVPNLQVALLSSTAGGDVFAARGETGALDNLF